MEDQCKTKEQLIEDLIKVRHLTAELKKSEKELRKAKESLQKESYYLDNVNDTLIVINANQEIIKVNKEFSNLWGYSSDEVLGKSVLILFPQEEMPIHLAEMEKSIVTEDPRNFETFALTKSGQKVPLSIRGSSIFDKDGKLEGFMGILRDITERKKAEKQILEQRNLFETILNASPDLIVLKDRNSVYKSVNSIFCNFIGKHQDEIIGKTDFDLFPAAEAEMYTSDDAKVMESGKPQIRDEEVTGEKRFTWLQVAKNPVQNIKGEITGILCSVRDITARKKTEIALKISEERFRGAFETAAIGIALVSPEGDWLQVNPVLCEIVGYSEQELLALTFQDITYPDDLETDLGYVKQMLAGKLQFYHMEKRYIHKKGHIIWILLSVSLVRDELGKPIHFVSQIQDITERKKAEEALQRAHDELELRVRERTSELQEKNIALKVLLKQREEDKNELEQNILSNIKSLVQPYIIKLKRNNKNFEENSYLNLIESNLEDIISPFSQKLSSNYMQFTSKEIQIANLIKEGKKDKEIMEIMHMAFDTVKAHRKNIRKKLGITGTGTNLRNKLLSM